MVRETHLIERVSLQDIGHIKPGRQLLSQRGLACMKCICVMQKNHMAESRGRDGSRLVNQ